MEPINWQAATRAEDDHTPTGKQTWTMPMPATVPVPAEAANKTPTVTVSEEPAATAADQPTDASTRPVPLPQGSLYGSEAVHPGEDAVRVIYGPLDIVDRLRTLGVETAYIGATTHAGALGNAPELAARHGIKRVTIFRSRTKPIELDPVFAPTYFEAADALGVEIYETGISFAMLKAQLKAGDAKEADKLLNAAGSNAKPLRPASDDPDAGTGMDDAAYADAIVAKHGTVLRYVRERKAFAMFDGGVWRKVTTSQVYKRARDTADDIRQKSIPPNADPKRYRTWVGQLKQTSRIKAALDQVEGMVSCSAADFDQRRDLLNCRNGTVELPTADRPTIIFREHRPEDLITRMAPVAYAPDAECPMFAGLIARALAPYGDDRDDVKRNLQQICGYVLDGDKDLKRLLYLWGPRHSGKSLLTSILLDVMNSNDGTPGYAMSTRAATFLRSGRDHRFALGDVDGVRLLTADEMPSDAVFNVELVKTLTGGRDTIPIERKNEQPYAIRPQLVPWLFGNSKPLVSDNDPAFFDRPIILGFSATVPEPERDSQLGNKIQRNELPGVLNWMLKGLEDLRANGLHVADVIQQAGNDYAQQAPVARFVAENCFTQDDYEAGRVCFAGNHRPGMRLIADKKTLYRLYTKWCKDNGTLPKQSAKFAEDLRQAGYERSAYRPQDAFYFDGLAFNGRTGLDNPEYRPRPTGLGDTTPPIIWPKPTGYHPNSPAKVKTVELVEAVSETEESVEDMPPSIAKRLTNAWPIGADALDFDREDASVIDIGEPPEWLRDLPEDTTIDLPADDSGHGFVFVAKPGTQT